MKKYEEVFFIAQPIPTDDPTVYLDGESRRPLKWSGTFPIPAVGTKIFVTMNGIGWAYVKGYFYSETQPATYVGVMTLATKPPTWLRRQQRENAKRNDMPQWLRAGIGCEFGTEIALKRPAKKKVVVA